MSLAPEAKMVSIILAGGRGTRMRSDTTHKVCYEVGGVPIILRALNIYQQCGLDHQIIVVGALGKQVVETVGTRVPNVSFAYQPEPLGTGNATKYGAQLLRDVGYNGLVLVVVGDRLVAPHIVHRLRARLSETESDVTFLVGSKEDNPSSGRVVFDGGGNAAAIVETSEIALGKLVSELDQLHAEATASSPALEQIAAGQVLELIRGRFPADSKARKVCGDLFTQAAHEEFMAPAVLEELIEPLREKCTLTIWSDGQPQQLLTAEVEELTTEVNLSAYLFRAPALYTALDSLQRNNAQGEEFLTDAIKNMGADRREDGSPKFKLTTVLVDHPDDSMSFNTPEELAEMQRKLRLAQPVGFDAQPLRSLPTNDILRPVSEWRQLFERNAPEVFSFLSDTYGPEQQIHKEKRHQFLCALNAFIELYGPEREVIIIRSPGRINVMGRHIDHRGGNTNVIAISDEIIMIAAPRDDDLIRLNNTAEPLFADTQFSLSQQIAHLDWSDWLSCVNSPQTLALVSNGDWSNYIRAAVLRLQERFRRFPLRGMDLLTHGTIPIGSGLSSSSAIVVGAAEALIAINGLPVRPNILVDLCGEGEWFVGTRGGANDHAAIKFSKLGYVAHVSFFPFEIQEFLPFFEDYCVVVCSSGIQSKKSEGSRSAFNQRVLGYVAGELIIKQLLSDFAPSIHHLRDVTCQNLGIDLVEIYRILKELPLSLTREQLFAEYAPFDRQSTQKLNNLFVTLPDDGEEFAVRGVTLFGLAEMERARRCVEYLRSGDAQGFGALWYISHDGDRVVSHDEQLRPIPWNASISDEYLDGLIADLQSGAAQRVARAQLHRQPGQYACSIPEIDLIVDLAKTHPGVMGAQIAGAGLGGCAIILTHSNACDEVVGLLKQHGFSAKRYYPVKGAGVVGEEQRA